MRAFIHAEYGPPEVLRLLEVEKPTPKNNEVLIRVRATTVNRTDCGFRLPEYFVVRLVSGLFRPRRRILGSEFAGEIAAVGKDVTSFREGDQVFGLTGIRFGAHAEYLCVLEAGAIATKPINMTYEEAAAVCDGMMLALAYLRKVRLRSGQSILVYGASGSIGTAGVQLAKHYDADVTAVCDTKNLVILKTLGADRVIDYTREDFTQNGRRYDVIFDAVGKSSFFRCRKCLNKGGVYMSTELGFLGQNPLLALWTAVFGSRRVLFPIPKEHKEDILFFKELIEAGRYKAVIDRIYSLEQVIEATKYVEAGQKTGNVVITIVGTIPPSICGEI